MPDRLTAALSDRYRIERELGQGGMATVYLAEDLKHKRKVALKVLKPELAAVLGAERFVQEITTTAALQHPHILPLFDSGEAGGFLYYVMPFIDGETLRGKLDRETQLGIEESVRIASDVASALHYAHEHGVIHRDIKPENILLHDGRPMVADFGIALAVSAAAGGRMTETGLSLGTPHYMSPEQATAEKEITARSDVYSLGSVLYEMLTGNPPHMGSSAQQIIMKIIAEDAQAVTRLRKSVPRNVAAAVAKSLEKLPADRFESAKAFAEALGNPAFTTNVIGHSTGARRSPPAPWVTYALGAFVVILAGMVALRWPSSTASGPSTGTIRFPLAVGTDTAGEATSGTIERTPLTGMSFSPDGRRLVYMVARPNKPLTLFEHRMDLGLEAPLLESDAANFALPAFSPKGEWLAFVRVDSGRAVLERMSMVDRSVETIAPILEGITGLSYGDDGTIVGATRTGLYGVSASGGTWRPLAEVDSTTMGITRWFQPHMLPESKMLLFHAARSQQTEDADIMALDLASGAQHVVLTNGMNPIYMPGGYLLFLREGTLMGVRLDPDRAEVQGQPVLLATDIMQSLYRSNTALETGAAQIAVSRAGHLAYAAGGVERRRVRRLAQITISGDTVPLALESRAWHYPRVSPDGTRILVMSSGKRQEIWIHNLERGLTNLLKTGGNQNSGHAWSLDGQSVVYSSDRDQPGVYSLYRMPADGSSPPERLAGPDVHGLVSDWSSQGVIVYLPQGRDDIWVLPPGGEAQPFVATPAVERWPAFSPDGHWIVYGSAQDGRQEVVVRPYPAGEPAILVAAGNVTSPSWSRDGLTIFYRQDNSLMAVDLPNANPTLLGRPRQVGPGLVGLTPLRGYDIFANGTFLTTIPDSTAVPQPTGTSRIEVIMNYLDEFKVRVKP